MGNETFGNESGLVEAEIEVYGRVQGVNFRNTVKGIADSFSLKGYARNRESGEVVIVVQGSKEKVKEFILEIKKSPGFSDVRDFNYEWKEISIRYKDFSVPREGAIKDRIKSVKNLGRFLFGREINVPEHVVIIPDGNRRWAKDKGLSGSEGHVKSATMENLISLLEESKSLGIKYISLWAFSTENWKRDEKERKVIFDLLRGLIEKLEKYAHEKKIRFRHIGRKDRLPRDLIKELEKFEESTKSYSELNFSLFLDYGGRDEIVRAVNKALKSGEKKVDEKSFEKFLDTFDLPDPALIIRTSGEKRTSGLLSWQSAYSEWYFSDVYFPDFDVKEFRKAISEYSRRQRRFGGN
ncbi:MAG: polyprenyl diphosphate synthase [Nanoarchaeota archaeon]|nr:polyprenyl diphosphate synthase [Nanoarchaeota archaeon]